MVNTLFYLNELYLMPFVEQFSGSRYPPDYRHAVVHDGRQCTTYNDDDGVIRIIVLLNGRVIFASFVRRTKVRGRWEPYRGASPRCKSSICTYNYKCVRRSQVFALKLYVRTLYIVYVPYYIYLYKHVASGQLTAEGKSLFVCISLPRYHSAYPRSYTIRRHRSRAPGECGF